MTSPTNSQHPLFGDTSMKRCSCGCGQYFFIHTKDRKRKYINDTHKKRVARRLKKERAERTQVVLTPKGWAYLEAKDDAVLAAMWADMTHVERLVLELVCFNSINPDELRLATENLFSNYSPMRDYYQSM